MSTIDTSLPASTATYDIAAGAVVASGISCAVFPAPRAAAAHAVQSAPRFVYDPKYPAAADNHLGRG